MLNTEEEEVISSDFLEYMGFMFEYIVLISQIELHAEQKLYKKANVFTFANFFPQTTIVQSKSILHTNTLFKLYTEMYNGELNGI